MIVWHSDGNKRLWKFFDVEKIIINKYEKTFGTMLPKCFGPGHNFLKIKLSSKIKRVKISMKEFLINSVVEFGKKGLT